MRIAITGSNGYVGNFLAQYFSDKGISVIGLDIKSSQRQNSYFNFQFVKCDVRNEILVREIFRNKKITHVIHLAYLMDPQHDKKFEDDVDINGSVSVFLAANSTKTIRQFIHFSSTSVYGGWKDNPLWIPETYQLKPRDWVYAQNKKHVEEFYFSYPKKNSLNLVNLRMCTAVGPSYFKSGGVVKTLHKSPISLLINGNDTLIQFIHEDDVIRIIDLIVNDDKIKGVFNLCSNSYASTKELNSKKLFIKFPKKMFKIIISVLWNLRIISVSPTSVNLVTHGIVASPTKLMKRYSYKFLYSTKSAYDAAVKARIKNGTL